MSTDLLPGIVTDTIASLSRLPGIGPRSAQRLAYFLLQAPEHLPRELGDLLMRLQAETELCRICCNICDTQPCGLCSSRERDRSVICVVEEPQIVSVIDRMGQFNGLYHVLHGTLSPLDGRGPEDIRLKELWRRLDVGGEAEVREVIVATSPDLPGQATAQWIADELRDHPIKVSQLARGLAAGSDLEYADDVSFRFALEGRRTL